MDGLNAFAAAVSGEWQWLIGLVSLGLLGYSFLRGPSLNHASAGGVRLKLLRALSMAVLAVLAFRYIDKMAGTSPWPSRFVAIVIVGYAGYTCHQVLAWWFLCKFGRRRELEGETLYADTYNSRTLSLLTSTLVVVATLLGGIQLLGFQSLLEAGGVIGFLGVLLALTQSSWAPDIISGLVLLNSRFVQEGDVILVDEGKQRFHGLVFRIKFFHTELLNLANNHRIMVRNARLREFDLHNLSRFASPKGLREGIFVNVDYDADPKAVRNMLADTHAIAASHEIAGFEAQHPPEVEIENLGDYAVTWSLFYYVKDLRQLLVVRKRMLAAALEASRKAGISLATPVLLNSSDGIQATDSLGDAVRLMRKERAGQAGKGAQAAP